MGQCASQSNCGRIKTYRLFFVKGGESRCGILASGRSSVVTSRNGVGNLIFATRATNNVLAAVKIVLLKLELSLAEWAHGKSASEHSIHHFVHDKVLLAPEDLLVPTQVVLDLLAFEFVQVAVEWQHGIEFIVAGSALDFLGGWLVIFFALIFLGRGLFFLDGGVEAIDDSLLWFSSLLIVALLLFLGYGGLRESNNQFLLAFVGHEWSSFLIAAIQKHFFDKLLNGDLVVPRGELARKLEARWMDRIRDWVGLVIRLGLDQDSELSLGNVCLAWLAFGPTGGLLWVLVV